MSLTPLMLAAVLAVPSPAPAIRLGYTQPLLRARKLTPLIPVVTVGATLVVLITDQLSLAVTGLLIGTTTILLIHSHVEQRHQRRDRETVTHLLGDVLADLEAGADPAAALHRAAQELQPEAGAEITRVIEAAAGAAAQGQSPASVLAAQPTSHPLRAVGKAWSVAEEYGISLSTVLSSLRTQLLAELRHRSATTATLQGPQATALILSLLPLAGLGLGSSMGANPIGWLLGGGLGGVTLVIGTALNCAGLLVSQRIIEGARS